MQTAKSNSFWYLTFHFSRMAVVFLGTIIISRILGPSEFGNLSYLISVFLYISTLDSLCHHSTVKKLLTENEGIDVVMGSASVLCGYLVMASAFLMGLFAYFLISEKDMSITLLLISLGLLAKLSNPIAFLFDANLMSKYSTFAALLGAVTAMSFRVGSLPFSHSLLLQGFGQSLQLIVMGAALFVLYKRYFPRSQWRVSTDLIVRIVKQSIPIFLSTAMFMSLVLCDIFMIKHLLNAEAIGIYSITIKLSEPWVIISSALSTSYFPLIFKSKDKSEQTELFIQANQISILFVVISGIVFSLTIDQIVSLLLGTSYSEVSGVFRIYYWSIAFLFLANIQHLWEVLNNEFSLVFYRTGFAFIMKLILNYLLGSAYGLEGFALATLISYFFFGMGFNAFRKKTRTYLWIQLATVNYKSLVKLFNRKIPKGNM